MCFACELRTRAAQDPASVFEGGLSQTIRINSLLHLYRSRGAHLELTRVQAELLKSAAARDDWRQVETFLRDWGGPDTRKVANVSKWVPGAHYYALNDKFDTLAAAKSHLTENGYQFGEFIKRYIPEPTGG